MSGRLEPGPLILVISCESFGIFLELAVLGPVLIEFNNEFCVLFPLFSDEFLLLQFEAVQLLLHILGFSAHQVDFFVMLLLQLLLFLVHLCHILFRSQQTVLELFETLVELTDVLLLVFL
jgi:hypothetical protein